MNKQVWRKIIAGRCLSPKDLTADEKKQLYELMSGYDMPVSSAYRRFFEKGFDAWELCGVSQIKDEFLITSACDTDCGGNGEEGTRGYGYVQTLSPDYDGAHFYDLVTSLKMGVRLCDYMAERGMASQATVRNRFKADDWKAWERMGVANILRKHKLLCNEEEDAPAAAKQ